MFASVAIGLGVDFAIHTIDRIKHLFAERSSESFDATIAELFPSTGRALLFNFLAIGLGFGVLMFSDVVPLFRFGAIVLLAISASFIASMTLLPALIKVIRPSFIKNVSLQQTKKINLKT
jgi:predicted RND superfamily exporter protein